jgi:hypothetical protein
MKISSPLVRNPTIEREAISRRPELATQRADAAPQPAPIDTVERRRDGFERLIGSPGNRLAAADRAAALTAGALSVHALLNHGVDRAGAPTAGAGVLAGVPPLGEPGTKESLGDVLAAVRNGDRGRGEIGIVDILGFDPAAPEAAPDLEQLLLQELQAQAAALRSALAAAGLAEHEIALLFGDAGSPGEAALVDAIVTHLGAKTGNGNLLPEQLHGTSIAEQRSGSEVRAGLAGADDDEGAETPVQGQEGGGEAGEAGAGAGKQPSGSSKPSWVDRVLTFLSNAASAALPAIAGQAATIGLATTDEESARNTAEGIFGVHRSGATATSNQHAADQLRQLEKEQSNRRPGSSYDNPNAPQTTLSEEAARRLVVRLRALVDPVGPEDVVEHDVGRLAAGIVAWKQSTVNPAPGGGEGGQDAAGGGVPGVGPGVVDPTEPLTPVGEPRRGPKPDVGPGGPIPGGVAPGPGTP